MKNTPSAPHAIQGSWRPVRLEFSGQQAPDLMLSQTEAVFNNGVYLMRFGGETTFEGKYTLTETTLHIEGSQIVQKKAMSFRGIYQLVGDRLRLCLAINGPAPEEFISMPGSNHYLGTYRRIV